MGQTTQRAVAQPTPVIQQLLELGNGHFCLAAASDKPNREDRPDIEYPERSDLHLLHKAL
jgi:hypothetical protein